MNRKQCEEVSTAPLRNQAGSLGERLADQEAEIERLTAERARGNRRVARLTTRVRSLSRTVAEQNKQLAEGSRAINQSRAAAARLRVEAGRLAVELTEVQAQLRDRDERIAPLRLALGPPNSRPTRNELGFFGRMQYRTAILAVKIPLWLLTFNLRPRLKCWLEARAIRRNGLFDDRFYLTRYPEVARAGIDPLYHFVRFGVAEGRDPNPLFSTSFYLSENPDVASSGINPLVHFIHAGASEGRAPSPGFDPKYYLRQNPDVAEAGINPLLHYFEVGVWEGRAPKPPQPLAKTSDVQKMAASAPLHESAPPAAPDEPEEPVVVPAPFPAVPSDPEDRPRVMTIAFYLPQFHPIPENDEFWGVGFTEWSKVSVARPLFPGHEQPLIPSELGFYDLRLPTIRAQQAELAREHGIYGFCYYYFWFGGRKLLERPLYEMLDSGTPDFPFCICWSNENWTRRWDGMDEEVLLAQEHSLESDARFIEDVIPILLDPRYICVNGKPVLLVYRADLLADPLATAGHWRELCRRAGLPGLFLCAVEFYTSDPRPLGFDALIEFPPHLFHQRSVLPEIPVLDPEFKGKVLDYGASVAAVGKPRPSRGFPVYRCVMPGWDNTARRKEAPHIYHGSTPELYGQWLERVLRESASRPGNDPQFVFINAWNEWAEGAFLEPSENFGRSYLEATREAVVRASQLLTEPAPAKAFPPLTEPAEAFQIVWQMNQEHASSRDERSRPVLFVSHDAWRAGSQLILLEIIKHFVELRDLEVFVLLCAGGEIEEDFKTHAHVINLGHLTTGGEPELHAIDAIVADFAGRDPLLAVCNTVVSSKVGMACKRAGIPVLSLIYELPTSIETALGQHTLEDTLEASKRVVVASQFVKDSLTRRYGIDPDRLTPIHTGVLGWNPENRSREAARARVMAEFDLSEDSFLVFGCGAIHHRKGTDVFVQLAQEVKEMEGSENFFFLWIGVEQGGPTFRHWCEHDIRAAGLQGIVKLAGGRKNTADYFAAADAFALTSREDPFPMVNLEAMARGVPVVAFADAGGAPEVLGDRAGIVVPYLDIEAMARALICLCEAPRFREEISRNALEKMHAGYRWERYVSDLLSILRDEFGYQSAAEHWRNKSTTTMLTRTGPWEPPAPRHPVSQKSVPWRCSTGGKS